MVQIRSGGVCLRVLPVADPAALAAEWQALEACAEASFFQSWSWVGCLAGERFASARLLRAERDGATLALALLNRAHGRLWLGESGAPALDSVYVEHNGPLLARGAEGVLPACLRALLAERAVRLSGVGEAVLAAARAAGTVRVLRSAAAPFIDCAALHGPLLDALSANTRYQLRRSDRAYAAAGPIVVERAASAAQALDWLAALAVLHQATWQARGQPGAFAEPAFLRFHQTLLARALPRGEAELLRIAAGGQTVGYLYNFRWRGRVLAYQSGFDYAGAPRHGKPGLTCHHAAIALARAEGATVYDFLAGEDRYKTSLANAATTLHWIDVARHWSLAGLALRARAAVRP